MITQFIFKVLKMDILNAKHSWRLWRRRMEKVLNHILGPYNMQNI